MNHPRRSPPANAFAPERALSRHPDVYPTFRRALEEHLPSAPRLLVALSGGSDSVALAALVLTWREQHAPGTFFLLAHLDHELRGHESRADARWCAALAERCGLPIEIDRCDVAALAAEEGRSIEAAGRTARTRFLSALAERHGCTTVLTAHHRDDQVETVLARVQRMSGSRGRSGIRRARPLVAGSAPTLVRPLLDLGREELAAWRRAAGLGHREDRTNAEPIADRNRIRLEGLPALRAALGPSIDAQLLKIGEASRRVAEHDRASLDRFASSIIATGPHRSVPPPVVRALAGEGRLLGELAERLREGWPIAAVATCPPTWRRTHHRGWRELFDLRSRGATLDLPGPWIALRAGGHVHLLRTDRPDDGVPAVVRRTESSRHSGPAGWSGSSGSPFGVAVEGPGAGWVRGARASDRWRTPTGHRRVGELLRAAGIPHRWRASVPVVAPQEAPAGTELLWIPPEVRGGAENPRAIEARLTLPPTSILAHLLRVAAASTLGCADGR